jgi:hypothetical protein
MSCLGFRVRMLSTMLVFVVPSAAAIPAVRVVHVFVALADNQHQGIVPVPAKLGNRDVPTTNLYWGAAFGVKTYFRASSDWKLVSDEPERGKAILERCIFKYRAEAVYLVAEAYRGSNIRDAVTDFLTAAAGHDTQTLRVTNGSEEVALPIGGGADLNVYVGHDAFMDFQITPIAADKGSNPRPVIVLACASRIFFGPYIKDAGAEPLLWTTGLMAPEAYTLKAALDGWIAYKDANSIRLGAAEAYEKYQHCGLRGAQRLFVSGW